ncbi:hypothetical protein [Flavivirga spongiicola]|uniref:Uncharacterized protein n=1 Tax=Flavivirga spongiicola TaxID=421621 RepID=A0ABU7XYL1_9FLAO|nr:hypothetical protein [Flavivirga sp. MEBiC05379]MDO5980864.1 hypothetical protein [Flavivirga sp. MEBiC05379]
MKTFKFLFIPCLLLVTILVLEDNSNTLNTGDIVFTSFNATGNDSFSITALKSIKPKTTIFFTDAKWNGSRFRIGGNHLIWVSGDKEIKEGALIEFKNIKTEAIVTFGKITSNLAISKKGDAIYAYTGSYKMPSKFLAGIANNINDYGTLINTGLEEGKTTITFPNGTYFANYKLKLKNLDRIDFLEGLKKLENYTIKPRL